MINVVTVNYSLNGDGVVNTEIDGDETLLDADLVVIDPSEFYFIWEDHLVPRRSAPTVNSPSSDRIRNIFASRRNEIETLLSNGKVIITFIHPVMGFNAEMNSRSEYDIVTNYSILPVSQEYLLDNLKSGKSGGRNSIHSVNPKSLFAPYFKAFNEELEYTAYLDVQEKDNPDYFLLNRSHKPVGFIIKISNGILVFLPPPKYNFNNPKLFNTLISCAKKFLTKHEVTPPPGWADNYKLKGEEEFDSRIEELNMQLENIIAEKKDNEERKNKLIMFKSLLFEQGLELENVVIESFNLLGFSAENRRLDDLEHDVIFESKEGKGIAEIEGKDNDSINIQKLDQLNRAVDEDFELTGDYAQGVLIGNHYRFTNPESRKEPFTDKVHIVAKKKNFGLLTTTQIFKAIQYILENPKDEDFKKRCRVNILTTTGNIIKLID